MTALTSLGWENVEYHEQPQDLNDYQKVRGGRQISFQQANVIVPFFSIYIIILILKTALALSFQSKTFLSRLKP